MKRTRYFTIGNTDGNNGHPIKLWRYKNGKMMYFHSDRPDLAWRTSCCVLDGTNNGQGWRQIMRDEARKLEPKAFR